MTPSVILTGVVFHRLRTDSHWSGRFQCFHISNLALAVLSAISAFVCVILLHFAMHLPRFKKGCENLYVIFGFMVVILLLEMARAGISIAIVHFGSGIRKQEN